MTTPPPDIAALLALVDSMDMPSVPRDRAANVDALRRGIVALGEQLWLRLANIDAATEAARAAPPPDLQAAYTNVWADGGSSWRN